MKVGKFDGRYVGSTEGMYDGFIVGTVEGGADGCDDGCVEGEQVGDNEGCIEGTVVGSTDGSLLGANVGSLLGINVCKPLVIGTTSATTFEKAVTFIELAMRLSVLVKLPSVTAFDID